MPIGIVGNIELIRNHSHK